MFEGIGGIRENNETEAIGGRKVRISLPDARKTRKSEESGVEFLAYLMK